MHNIAKPQCIKKKNKIIIFLNVSQCEAHQETDFSFYFRKRQNITSNHFPTTVTLKYKMIDIP